ncbi:hypothetical protein [Mycolicibacterium brisbanense]|uniref:Endonuclease/exonuclease/phosphatase family protein n=1 Tax=Mycolicibacterium brisbanense TaxID=146020 RepID=A0A100W6M3_9MYCO|nr:hypothetical protein [Mycolicibacterium brisbanense]MCV7158003.1 hypothetical protein [Mycolicibacterium brisbanense]GAS92651.1 endonuclease/exonuclease/phosphatase family protein [Mycolicibacterium brisbanense]
MNLICGLFRAIAGGIDLAAEVLCPMDHTGARRAAATMGAAAAGGAVVGDPAAPRDRPCACGAGYSAAADCPWCRNTNDEDPSPEPERPAWIAEMIREGQEGIARLAVQIRRFEPHYVLPVNDWIRPNENVLCPKCNDQTWTVATMNGQYVICAEHGQIAHR